MRPRFSLRLFLIAFTLLAILFGGAAHFVYRVKDQIRRHREAAKTLKSKGILERNAFNLIEPSRYESFAQKWIDPEAFATVSSVHLFNPHGKYNGNGDYWRYKSNQIETILETLRDVHRVPGFSLRIDLLTAKSARLLALHQRMTYLYLNCKEIEPGAMRELASLRSLESIRMPCAIDDDSLSVIRNHPNLRSLEVNLSTRSEIDADILLPLKQLRSVTLINAGSKTRFLHSIAGQKQLRKLVLHDCDIDRAGAEALSTFPSLEEVEIEGKAAVDSDLWSNLANAKNLLRLSIEVEGRPSAKGIRELAKCTKLEVLDLDSVLIDSEDLNAFSDHPSLKKFEFRGEIPDINLKAFLKATPNCKIHVYNDKSVESENGEPGIDHRGTSYELVDGKLKK